MLPLPRFPMSSAKSSTAQPCKALSRPSVVQRWGIVAASVALALPLVASPAMTQEKQQALVRTLTVTGQGEEFVATSKAQISLGIEVQDKTADAAQSQAAKRSDAVVKFLKGRNVEKLQTTGISLNPRYKYDDGRQTLVGYTATNTVSFRVPNRDAGQIMDRAVKAGATRISGIGFVAEDAAIATAQKQALREATQDAQEQAEAVLDALNLNDKEIVSIQINGANPPRPVPMPLAQQRAFAVEADSAPTTPVVGGEQRVNASVTLQIRY